MRRVIVIILAAIVTVAVAWWIADLPGHIEVTIAGTTVNASAPVAVLALIILVLALYLLVRLIVAIVRIPLGLRVMRARGRRHRGGNAITSTLVAIAAGDRGDARREAARARRLLGDTPQTLLLAAEASRLAGNETEAANIYRKLAERDDAAFLGLRGLFRQAMAREDWPEAAAIAQRAERVYPGAAWLREERAQLAVRAGNWQQALTLAGPDAPTIAYTTAAAEAERNPSEALRLARQAFRDDPAFTPAALVYAKRLRADGRESRAQDVIRNSWKVNPNPELAALALAPIPMSDAEGRFKAGSRLAAANPTHVETYLMLARLSLEAGRPSEARRHAEAAQATGLNQRRLWVLFADIEAAERGETEQGRLAQRDALRRAATADPDPAWRCEHCGTVQASWAAACPACHTPGKINWAPPRTLRGETIAPPPAALTHEPPLSGTVSTAPTGTTVTTTSGPASSGPVASASPSSGSSISTTTAP